MNLAKRLGQPEAAASVEPKMPDFCTGHGIGAEIEVTLPKMINDAYERVLFPDVRYRFVIGVATL